MGTRCWILEFMIIKMATGGSDRDFNSDCNENKYFDKDQIHSDRSPTNDAENENKKPGILQQVIVCTLVP